MQGMLRGTYKRGKCLDGQLMNLAGKAFCGPVMSAALLAMLATAGST